MDRFGSSLFRIVWCCVALLAAGLVLGGVQATGPDASSLRVFGTEIPLGFVDLKPYVIENLGRWIYTMVPAIILLGGFLPLSDWAASGARPERIKGLFLGSGLAFLHGLFLSQVALLPVFAAGLRLLGSPFHTAILKADLNAVLLGLQLLLWATALGLLVKSNRGIAILLAYVLAGLGRLMAWGGEWLGDLEVSKGLVKAMALLGQALPAERLPSETPGFSALPLGLATPLLLAVLLALLPGKSAPKRSRG